MASDRQLLASDVNDNHLLVWNQSCVNPVPVYTDHTIAVKAIAWSPHQQGLLTSGGGAADGYIRFWNTLTAQNLQSIDAGSQMCNLAWLKHSNELVSTINKAGLTGHTCRLLYLAVSSAGEFIVTGAGDETFLFWNVFTKCRANKESDSVLNLTKLYKNLYFSLFFSFMYMNCHLQMSNSITQQVEPQRIIIVPSIGRVLVRDCNWYAWLQAVLEQDPAGPFTVTSENPCIL
ncbi:unnamed protein product [Rotaria sordida]|uniref:Uncharacterized protein n=1 Tax=Rotaria sordida TaxID=392033 RepID=A0A816C540_9BILA|nr:unnamed protein product [Rotaria sordida]CAF1617923.1 unnamed protein product [Rotaria sordida]